MSNEFYQKLFEIMPQEAKDILVGDVLYGYRVVLSDLNLLKAAITGAPLLPAESTFKIVEATNNFFTAFNEVAQELNNELNGENTDPTI